MKINILLLQLALACCLLFYSQYSYAQTGAAALAQVLQQYQGWAVDKKFNQLFGEAPEAGANTGQRSYQTSIDFGAFDLKIWRNVYPDLISKQGWVVDDQVSFYFKAEALIELFKQELSISDVNLGNLTAGAAAKVSIEKRFRSYHLHATKEAAYASDLRYLLTPFWFLTSQGIQELKLGDNIITEDWLYIDGQGKVHWSGPYGISGNISATASLYRASKREVAYQQRLLPGLRVGVEVEKRVGLSLEASLGMELYKFIQLSLFDFGLSYSKQSAYKADYLFPYDERFSSWENLTWHASQVLALTQTDAYNDFLVAKEFTDSMAFQTHLTFLIFRFAASENTEEKDLYINTAEGQEHQRFYRHDRRQEFKVNSLFSLFQGTLFGLIDFLYTAFRGIPYYTEKNSGVEYKYQENLLKKNVPYSLTEQQAFRSHRTYTHLVQRKGLWKWLSRLKLKGLFSDYHLDVTSQGDWREHLKNAQTPWRFENQFTLGLPGMTAFLSQDFESHKRRLDQACAVTSCRKSNYALLLDTLQDAWGVFSHREVTGLEREACKREVEDYLKAKSFWFKLTHRQNLRALCLSQKSFLDGEERLKYLNVKVFYRFWETFGGHFKGNTGLSLFFGRENVYFQTRFIYQQNNFPYLLEARSDSPYILRPSDQALYQNGLRAPASLLSTSSEF
ncbi:MAG: hypothetical protein A2X86_22150 [Bdellovibrionales bacterium GWA2_49_15]|nr:MAG: hypothetical protein A2X86_22150 [Bdellovibrionales bacterium GWA2_49_15]HAZ14819.1 hypothetical protein [Bdellovibrionales bacterium]